MNLDLAIDALTKHPDWQNSICLFTGSASGNSPKYTQIAKEIGSYLGNNGVPLVYGGGNKGMMGATAFAYLSCEQGSNVHLHSVIPEALAVYEKPGEASLADSPDAPPDFKNPKSSNEDPTARHILSVVKSMHQRKKIMARCTQLGFLALPGGLGTLEEVAEMSTWTQLSIHSLPVVLINIDGFFTPLKQFIRNAVEAGFIRPTNEDFIIVINDPKDYGEECSWGSAAIKAMEQWHKTKHERTPYSISWNET